MAMIQRLCKLLPSSYNSKAQAQLQFCRWFSSKLFVKGFTFRTTEDDLAKAFSEFGEVTEAKIIYNNLQKSKGFGYVMFNSVCEADDALVAMNGKLLDGRSIYVDHVKPNPFISGGIPLATGPPTPEGELPASKTEEPTKKTKTRKPKIQPSVPEEELPEPKTEAPAKKTRTRKPKTQPSVPEPPQTQNVVEQMRKHEPEDNVQVHYSPTY